jgi:hypothetical protein
LGPLDIAGWGCLALLTILLLFSAWQGPDIYGHIHLGQKILETGKAQPADGLILKQPSYVNVYWLFQVAVAAVYGMGGVVGVTLFFLVLWLAILFLFVRLTGCDRNSAIGIPFMTGAVLVLAMRFHQRPEILSYLLLMLQLTWLTTWDFRAKLPARKLILFGVTQVLWSNVHLFFVFGPLLVGLRLLAAAFEKNNRGAPAELAKLMGICLLATLVSPLALRNWAYVLTAWRFVREMHGGIAEFRSPATLMNRLWSIPLFWIYWGGTILAAAWALARRRLTLFAALAAIPALSLSATSVRNMPLALLMGAPIWRDLFRAWEGARPAPLPGTARAAREATRPRRARAAQAAVVAGSILCLVLSAWVVTGGYYRSQALPSRLGLALEPAAFPVYVERYLANADFKGRVLNNSFDGAYLEWRFPRISFYTDPRYVESGPVREYFAALRDPQAFRRLHARVGFDAVLLQVIESGQLTAWFMTNPEWRLVYADPHRALFAARASAEAAKLPVDAPRFYRGEDLSFRANGITAIQWMHVLVVAQAREQLVDALQQFSQARGVPAPVVEFGLRFGLERKDSGVLQAAAALYPRIVTLAPEERAPVDQLMQAARNLPGSGIR